MTTERIVKYHSTIVTKNLKFFFSNNKLSCYKTIRNYLIYAVQLVQQKDKRKPHPYKLFIPLTLNCIKFINNRSIVIDKG